MKTTPVFSRAAVAAPHDLAAESGKAYWVIARGVGQMLIVP